MIRYIVNDKYIHITLEDNNLPTDTRILSINYIHKYKDLIKLTNFKQYVLNDVTDKDAFIHEILISEGEALATYLQKKHPEDFGIKLQHIVSSSDSDRTISTLCRSYIRIYNKYKINVLDSFTIVNDVKGQLTISIKGFSFNPLLLIEIYSEWCNESEEALLIVDKNDMPMIEITSYEDLLNYNQ